MVYIKIPRIKKQCRYCGKTFLAKVGQLSCSQNCNVMWNRYKAPKSETHTKKCLWCENKFIASRIDDKYCCNNCGIQYRIHKKDKKRTTLKKLEKDKRRVCAWCGEKFNTRRNSQRCCSAPCYERYYEKYKRNGEKARQRARKHYWKNRDKKLAKDYNITIKQYLELTKKCVICGFQEIVDCHHIIPVSKGGKNKFSNYVGLCPNHHKLIHLRKYKIEKVNNKWIMKEPKE